ncbi:unnamed protein product [Closterium sp. NIES-54]
MKRGDRCRLLSLPDEVLESILSTINHPSDRCNVALVCSRLRRISRRTPHSLLVEFMTSQPWRFSVQDWLGELDVQSRAFPNITSLIVRVTDTLRDSLLAGIGTTCRELKELRLLAVNWGSFEATASGWLPLARQCPENIPPLPPLHAFPSLRAVTLGFYPKEISPLLRCSALTSLSLWKTTGGNLALLASPSSSFRSSLQSLTFKSANLTNYLSRVSSFTSLSSLSLHSCEFNSCELHSLSRPLHSLMHLTIDNCPLVCCRAMAAMVRANPSLSTLSLSLWHLLPSFQFQAPIHRASPVVP